MQTWSLIYKGPTILDDPERGNRICDAVVSWYPLTRAETAARLEQAPFSLVSGLSKTEVDRKALFLRALGAQVEVLPEDGPPETVDLPESITYPARRWPGRVRGGIRSLLFAFAPGLLLTGMMLIAGLAQIVGAWYLFRASGPFYPLSAAGWATIGAALFIFAGLAMARLPLIIRAFKPPQLDSPLTALNSFFNALGSRNWEKALACLAGAEGGAAGMDLRAALKTLRQMGRRFVFPDALDPRSCGFSRVAEQFAELRFALPLTDRTAQSDGTRLRRTLVDVRRFVRREGRWYLLDGWIFAQRDISRVPVPACRVCGGNVSLGEKACLSCAAPLPPWDIAAEEWAPSFRKPDLAALLSAIVPGLGQTYNGQPLKGVMIAATCWMILPWAAGVIDAVYTAERVNRRSSAHDAGRTSVFALLLHVLLFVSAVSAAVFYADRLPLVREIILASQPTPEELSQSPIIARFRGNDGNYSILFPYRWQVKEIPDPGAAGTTAEAAVRAVSRDGLSTIIISTRPKPSGWNPCPQAMQARNLLEAEGALIANVECGSRGGREQYRVDSFTADRDWRRTLLVLAFERELVILAFVCPAAQQETMVGVFDDVTDSIRYAQNQRDTIRR